MFRWRTQLLTFMTVFISSVFVVPAVFATELDSAQCAKLYQLYQTKCELGEPKEKIPAQFTDCNTLDEGVKSQVAPLVQKLVGAADAPAPGADDCKKIHTVFYLYNKVHFFGDSADAPRRQEQASLEEQAARQKHLENQLKQFDFFKGNDLPTVLGNRIKLLLGLMGSIALAMFVYGGVLFMIAQGNAETAKKAMGVLVWGALGMLVILASYALVRFIFDIF